MRQILTITFCFAFALSMVGCDSNGGGSTPMAQVRFMHASPGAGQVSVVVDGNRVLEGVPFSAETQSPTVSGYTNVPVGSDASIEVQDASGNTVVSTSAGSANLEENTQYTIIVAGAANADNAPEAIVLRDQLRENLGENEVALRLVHGAAMAGAVDIYRNQPGTELTQEEIIAQNFQFGADIPGGFAGQFLAQPLSEEGSVFVVTPTGETTRVLELPVGTGSEGSLEVQAGMYITAVAIDDPGSDAPAGALVQIDVPGS